MQMLNAMLKQRKLPELRTREEMLSILLNEEYGIMPPLPEKMQYDVEENFIRNFCAGKIAM